MDHRDFCNLLVSANVANRSMGHGKCQARGYPDQRTARFHTQVLAGFDEARAAAIAGMQAAYATGEPQARTRAFLDKP